MIQRLQSIAPNILKIKLQ